MSEHDQPAAKKQVSQSSFAEKYREGSDWGGHSGGGSAPFFVADYKAFLERFIYMNRVRTVVDIGCGDWQFSQFVNFNNAAYIGYDVVDFIIDRNNRRYAADAVTFSLMPDDLNDVPPADLLILKDVLQHLTDDEIMKFKTQVIPKFRFALVTNSYRKINTSHNVDIQTGGFRTLDLTVPPYTFPGAYVQSFPSPLWEELRVLLITRTPKQE